LIACLFFIAACVPRQDVDDAIIRMNPGSNYIFRAGIDSTCSPSSDVTYILTHENHVTGRMEIVSQQQSHAFTIHVQLNTSGVYCAYKQCAPNDKEQCCIRIKG